LSYAPVSEVGSEKAPERPAPAGRGLPGRGLPRKPYQESGASEAGGTAYSNQSEVQLDDLATVAGEADG